MLDTRTQQHSPIIRINQFELQEELQRFAGQFASRVTSAAEPLTDGRDLPPTVQHAALGRLLMYSTAALDIATGPAPEVNLLDMAVFLRLSLSTFESHWVHVFGDASRPLLDALRVSEQEIWELTSKLLPQEIPILSAITQAWLDDHPGNTNVELVRFREFASHVGQTLESAGQAQGVLKRVSAATMMADRALLLSERAIFLTQRMPFLLRLHTRLGAQDVLNDSFARLSEAARPLSERARRFARPASMALLGGALGLYAFRRFA